MEFFLGVDGGGTGCRARLVDASGQVLGEGQGGPANISSAPDTALASIMDCTTRALQGIDPARVSACLGLAGANAAGTAQWLSPRLPFGQSRIVSDALTTLQGALGGQDGIIAAMGTGSVFAGLVRGQYMQVGGWGFQLGDQGSGAALGRARIARALMAVDGLVPMTPLLQSALDRIGPPDAAIGFALSASPAQFGSFAPDLVNGDDPAIEPILSEAAPGVIAHVAHLQRALGRDRLLPVVWLGGLGPLWRRTIGHHWPVLDARGNALDGATAMALQLQENRP